MANSEREIKRKQKKYREVSTEREHDKKRVWDRRRNREVRTGTKRDKERELEIGRDSERGKEK